jgi:uncharacterized protein
MVNSSWYRWKSGALLLNIQVQTRASVNTFADVIGDRIKLRIKAPAVKNRANEAIIKFLGKEFKTAKSQVQILSGYTSAKKLVKVQDPARLPALPGLTDEAGNSAD